MLRAARQNTTMAQDMIQPASQTSSVTDADRSFTAASQAAPAAQKLPQQANNRVGWYARAKFGLVRWFLWAWVRSFSLRGLYLFGRFFGHSGSMVRL